MRRHELLKAVVAALLPCMAASGLTIDLAEAKVRCARPEAETCKTAAAELEKHLALTTPGRNGRGDEIFIVGEAPPGEPAPGRFASHARVHGGKVYFWGDDARRGMDTAKGTLYAVYEFLDKALGVKWVFAGDDGIVTRARRTLDLSEGMSWSFKPAFDLITIRTGSTNAYPKLLPKLAFTHKELVPTIEEFGTRCNMTAQWRDRMRAISANRFRYGHAFTKWEDRYFKKHPEWFGLDPVYGRKEHGFRGVVDQYKGRAKFCLSNPEVVEAVVADWKKRAQASRYFNICPNDATPGFCHCENCCRLDTRREGEAFLDHLTDRYLWFWNEICERAVKIRPDVRCVTYVYAYYRHPPRRERVKHPDNLVLGMVPALTDDCLSTYRAWKDAGMKHFFLRPNFLCYSSVFPRGLEKWLYDNFKESLEYGMMGVDYDGAPRPVLDFEYYTVTSLASRPDKRFDEIAGDFYSQFGAASDVGRAYYERVRARAAKGLASLRAQVSKKHVLDDSELSKYAVFGSTLADLEGDRAVLAAGDAVRLQPAERRRFDLLKLRADHAVLTMKFMMASKDGDDASFLEAADRLLAFRRAHRRDLGDEGFCWYSHASCEHPAWKREFDLRGR